MAMISDFDLKTLVCDNGSFGPDEIQQISNAINDDFSQFGILRDAVNELEISESLTPASATVWAYVTICWADLNGPSRLWLTQIVERFPIFILVAVILR